MNLAVAQFETTVEYLPQLRREEELFCYECGCRLDPYNVEPDEDDQGNPLCWIHARKYQDERDNKMERFRRLCSRSSGKQERLIRMLGLMEEADAETLTEFLGETLSAVTQRLGILRRKRLVERRTEPYSPSHRMHKRGRVVWFPIDPETAPPLETKKGPSLGQQLLDLIGDREMTTAEIAEELGITTDLVSGRLSGQRRMGRIKSREILTPEHPHIKRYNLWSVV